MVLIIGISIQKRTYSLYSFNIFDIFVTNIIALSVVVTFLKLLKLLLSVNFKFLIHFTWEENLFVGLLWRFYIFIHYKWLFSLVIICCGDGEVSPAPILRSCHSFSIYHWNLHFVCSVCLLITVLNYPFYEIVLPSTNLISPAYLRSISIRL